MKWFHECYQNYLTLHAIVSDFPDTEAQKIQLLQQLEFLKEDLIFSATSFIENNSVPYKNYDKNQQALKANYPELFAAVDSTRKMEEASAFPKLKMGSQIQRYTEVQAQKYYCFRMIPLTNQIFSLFKKLHLQNDTPAVRETTKTLISISHQIRQDHLFSTSDTGRNPYPDHLFFSQRCHAHKFSAKSGRAVVADQPIEAVAHALRTHAITPDDLRIEIFFAPYPDELHPFAYNNRTLVCFSKAGVDATRIVPCMPTQDSLNRVQKLLDEAADANTILDEYTEPGMAVSARTTRTYLPSMM